MQQDDRSSSDVTHHEEQEAALDVYLESIQAVSDDVTSSEVDTNETPDIDNALDVKAEVIRHMKAFVYEELVNQVFGAFPSTADVIEDVALPHRGVALAK